MQNDDRISRAIVRILRYHAASSGLAEDPNGFILVADMLQLPEFKGVDQDVFLRVVHTSIGTMGCRFELRERDAEEGIGLEIRAIYRHPLQRPPCRDGAHRALDCPGRGKKGGKSWGGGTGLGLWSMGWVGGKGKEKGKGKGLGLWSMGWIGCKGKDKGKGKGKGSIFCEESEESASVLMEAECEDEEEEEGEDIEESASALMKMSSRTKRKRKGKIARKVHQR
jgi:hypothetical protein